MRSKFSTRRCESWQVYDEDLGHSLVTDKLKVTTVQSVAVDRSTDSLETEAAQLFVQLSGKESSLHVPVFAFSYTAGGRAPALSFVVSLRTVLCLTSL